MGRTPSSTNKKTSELRSKNGNKPKSLTEGINEQVNAAEEKVQEIEERGKPKRLTIAELTKRLKATEELLEDYKKRHQGIEKAYTELRASYKETLARSGSLKEKNDSLIDENTKLKKDNDDIVANSQEVLAENKRLHDSNNQLGIGNEQLVNRNKQLNQENQELLDRKNGKIFNEEPQAANSEEFGKTETSTSEPKATSSENAEEIKSANSENFEETVAPETGEAKVEGEPKPNTEQAQATQEPAKETNARPGTGEATKDNVMSPEDAFKFFNDKKNYERASTVFKTPSFDRYIDSATGRWIPRSYFDAFNARDGINPKDFTFEHFKAKIPKDPGKPLTAEEETANLYNTTKAEEDYNKKYENFNTGFKAYLRRHPKLEKIVKTGKIVGGVSLLYGLGQILNDAFIAGQNNKDEVKDIAESLNDDDPEPLVGNVNNSPENIAAQLKGADESTGTPEDNSGTIEQAIAEQAPAGNVKQENPQVAANAATPANTKANKANKAPAGTAKSAPTKDTTQGLPPVVVNNTPPANASSKGMTYSQRVEAGQTPQEGSMTHNANNPDLVTAGLIDAMNQNPQAGSDAIGYGDLYDQNFIDYWAKRNPNLAFGVSQGRR